MRKLKWVALILVGGLLLSGANVALAEPPSAEHLYGWYPGVTLTVAVLSGVHPVPWKDAAKDFKNLTGVEVEVVEFSFSAIYDKLMTEAVSHSGAFDIMEVCNMWVPDFKAGNFILPLDDYIAKWNPNLEDIAEPVKKLMKYGESYVEKGQDYYEKQYKNRVVKNLQRRAQQMGFKLVAVSDLEAA